MPTRLILILLISTLLGARSADPTAPSRQGKDFALFFAVDTYEDPAWTDLNNPVRDAEAIAEELETHFGFETEVHRNPSLEKIRQVIINWQEKEFKDDAQLFIFFTGHGSVSDFDNEGYFMPADAEKSHKNHLSLLSLRQAINRIPCPHILLAVDACYSGTILQKGDEDYLTAPRRLGETAETRRIRLINTELTYPSRYIMTSGGRERTPDGKYHSPFAEGILNALSGSLREEGLAVWSYMVYQMESKVKNPRPRFGTFDGHRNGGFVFVRMDFDLRSDNSLITKQIKPLDHIPLPKMIEIPGGSFEMGAIDGEDDEKPVHKVKISSFCLAEIEVTNKLFCTFLNENGNKIEGRAFWIDTQAEDALIIERGGIFVSKTGKENHPAVGVSWYGAVAFCKWLSELSQEEFRLPSEAEWEFAAGGGEDSRTIYAGTNSEVDLRSYANIYKDEGPDIFWLTAPVGSLKPNKLGLYDMTGNVNEWCSDFYSDRFYEHCYNNSIIHNPVNKKIGVKVVCRGGFYFSDYIEPKKYRITSRMDLFPDYNPDDNYVHGVGFRIAKTLP